MIESEIVKNLSTHLLYEFMWTGETCSDPGRPPDAVQLASGYGEGQKVSYRCTREGFALNDSNPLSCVQDPTGRTLHWDLPVPVCKGEWTH